MAIVRRKRLADGTFGEPEKVMGGETNEEKVERLESENAALTFALLDQDMRLDAILARLDEGETAE